MERLMISSILLIALIAGAQAQIAAYGQCGGSNWCYNVDCQPGYTCKVKDKYYSQCLPASVPPKTLRPYAQCGGKITKPCSPGYSCTTSNGYSMCTPIIYTTLTTVNTCSATSTLKSSVKLASTTTSNFKPSSSSTKTGGAASSTSLKTSSSSTRVSTSTKASSSKLSSSSSIPRSSTTAPAQPQQTPYGQCGGIQWTGPTACTPGWTCIPQAGNPYYSQCLPSSDPPAASTTTTVPTARSSTSSISSVMKPSTTLSTSTQTNSVGSCTPSARSCGTTYPPPACAGKVKFAGINIAGCDFGTETNGNQSPSGAYCPIGPNNPNGPGQMAHFASEKFNIFRIPTGWQYIINSNTATSVLNPTNWGNYKNLVQACLDTGAYCMIDIHNYARFNGAIIGQGGPTTAVFAQFWANIATVYASNPKIMFGIMNEPHEVNIGIWAQTVQAVVTAIRNAGATSQMILLPGNGYTGAGTFINDGSAAALATVTNPDGSTTNLIFDVHKYLDSNGSGTGTICVGDQVSNAFAPLAQWLRCNGRQAILSETGGSKDNSCLNYMCSAISFLNANSDVYLGYIGWAAGSFDANYELAETPTFSNGVWTDTAIVSQCLVPH